MLFKNPDRRNSEVSHYLSDYAFALGGFTGGILEIDPVNEVFVCMLSNRCHNRITNIDSSESISISDNGKDFMCNKDYVYERDAIVEEAVKLALKMKS